MTGRHAHMRLRLGGDKVLDRLWGVAGDRGGGRAAGTFVKKVSLGHQNPGPLRREPYPAVPSDLRRPPRSRTRGRQPK
jgi:hypothetical protein